MASPPPSASTSSAPSPGPTPATPAEGTAAKDKSENVAAEAPKAEAQSPLVDNSKPSPPPADAVKPDAKLSPPPADPEEPTPASVDSPEPPAPPADAAKPSPEDASQKPSVASHPLPGNPAGLPVDPPPLPVDHPPLPSDAAGKTDPPTVSATGAPKAELPAEDTKGKKKEEEQHEAPDVSLASSNLGLPTLLITGDTLSKGLKRQQDEDFADENESPWIAVKKQVPMVSTGTRLLRSARNPEAARREVEKIKRDKEVYRNVQGKLEQVGQKMKNINHEFLPMDPLVFGDTDSSSSNHILAGDRSPATGCHKNADQLYKMKEPLKCALLFSDCTDNFTIEDPPEDPHQVLNRYEVNRFLSHHGLPPFKPDTYRYSFLPGCSEIGFGAPDDHWERHADCVIVLRPRDYNVIKSKAYALKQLNNNLLNMEMDQVKHLEATRRFMETFFYAKSQGVKNDSELLADLIVKLERELREKSENFTIKEKEVVEKAATIQMLQSQLRSKIHALDQCTTSLHECEDRNRWIEHKYDVVSASMFKIWVRTLLERVRKRMADDLRPFHNVIRFSRDNHDNMTNWHVTLRDLRNQPEACWLLADRGLDETVVELTCMNTPKANIYTLHQLANIAAHSARDEEIAEAITSRTMEQYKEALEKLFRYARGSDTRIEELKNNI